MVYTCRVSQYNTLYSLPPLPRFHLVRPNRQSLVLAYIMPGRYFTPTNRCTRQTSSTNTLNRHHHQTHNIHNIADIFRKNILNRCTSSPNTQHTHLQTSSPNTQCPRQQKSSTNMFHTSTGILCKYTACNFQFTPKLASSLREWSFSAAILINQGSGSREKLQDAKHYKHHRHTLNSFTRLPARIPALNHYQEMF